MLLYFSLTAIEVNVKTFQYNRAHEYQTFFCLQKCAQKENKQLLVF